MAKVDFISELPPEITVNILIYLSLSDVISCLRVCLQWYVRIIDLDLYWKEALRSLGVLQDIIISQYRSHYPKYKDLALKIYQTRQYIQASSPQVKQVSQTFSINRYFQCNYTRYGVLVGTLYEDFIPLLTAVYRVQPSTGVLKRNHTFLPSSHDCPHRVVWSSLYCDYMLLATANGTWQGHNLVSNNTLFTWQGPTLYDPDLVMGCCRDCYLVGIGKVVVQRRSKEIYWEIQILRLGRGYSIPTAVNIRLDIEVSIGPTASATSCCKNLGLISQSRDRDCAHFCSSHWLLLQWADSLYIHKVDSSGAGAEFLKPLLVLHCRINLSIEPVDRYKCSSFILSSDQSLLSFIHSGRLGVWNLSNLKLVSNVLLKQRPDKVQINLLAIGHIYTIVGYESIQGVVQVLSTYTGEVIFGAHGFVDAVVSNIGTPPPYFIFLGLVDEEWLNRVDCLPHPTMPTLLYWDKMKHGVFGIVFRHREIERTVVANSTSQITITTDNQVGFMKRFKNVFTV